MKTGFMKPKRKVVDASNKQKSQFKKIFNIDERNNESIRKPAKTNKLKLNVKKNGKWIETFLFVDILKLTRDQQLP